MSNNLLKVNIKLYVLLVVISIFYSGFDVGYHTGISIAMNEAPSPRFDCLFFVIVYGILWLISRCLYTDYTFVSVKDCFGMAFFTLIFASGYWISLLMNRIEDVQSGFLYPGGWQDKIAIIMYPAVLFCVSLVISISYIICAVQIRKENKALGQNS